MRRLAAILVLSFLTSCETAQRYYSTANVNRVALGQTKAQVMAMFPGDRTEGGAPGLKIIEASKSPDGRLREIGEVSLLDRTSSTTVDYKFTFEDGSLVHWGPY